MSEFKPSPWLPIPEIEKRLRAFSGLDLLGCDYRKKYRLNGSISPSLDTKLSAHIKPEELRSRRPTRWWKESCPFVTLSNFYLENGNDLAESLKHIESSLWSEPYIRFKGRVRRSRPHVLLRPCGNCTWSSNHPRSITDLRPSNFHRTLEHLHNSGSKNRSHYSHLRERYRYFSRTSYLW